MSQKNRKDDGLVFLDTGAGTATVGSGDLDLAEANTRALRERAATALERGLSFVDEHGDDFAKLRARVVLGAEPQEALRSWVIGWQHDDGSFEAAPRFALGLLDTELEALGEPAAGDRDIFETLRALSLLSDAQLIHAPEVEAAVNLLAARQASDGGWLEASPQALRQVASAALGGLLGKTRVVRPEVLRAAGDFVGAHWGPERVEDGRIGALVAYSLFFSNVAHDEADAALQWCGRELEKRFRGRRCEACVAIRVLLSCDALAMPGSQLDPIELLDGLLDEQAADGGFDALAAEGRPARVAPTIDAMRGVIALCGAF